MAEPEIGHIHAIFVTKTVDSHISHAHIMPLIVHNLIMHTTPPFGHRRRVPMIRLRQWDYAQQGAYFVTICTKNKYPWFGYIRDKTMHLSDIGRVADMYWRSIPDHFSHVTVDRYVIMPDHMHGIVVINQRMMPNRVWPRDVGSRESRGPTMNKLHDLTNNKHRRQKPIPRPAPGSLGSIINQYKTACTKHMRRMNPHFSWQPRFHDRIIRNNDELQRIRIYICNNPLVWENDHL